MSKSDDDNAQCQLGWDWVTFLVICVYIISVLFKRKIVTLYLHIQSCCMTLISSPEHTLPSCDNR